MSAIEFGVLGPLEVRLRGRLRDVGKRRNRLTLGVLLLDAGHPVQIDRLIELAWHRQMPSRTARNAIQVCVSQLRTVLGPSVPIISAGDGYLIDVARQTIDIHRFQSAIARARGFGPAQRAAELRAILPLWRGPLLAGTFSEELRQDRYANVEELRLNVMEDCLASELRMGRSTELLDELTNLVQTYPTRERFIAQSMLALHRGGRKADALELYRVTRDRFVRELAIEPGSELQQLHQQILRNDLEILTPPPPQLSVPQHLPADLPDFTGRLEALQQLDGWLAARGDGPLGAMVISAVTGTGGVGKTALAVRWAHAVTARFPDGQLYLNLRGYDRQDPVTVLQALSHLLRSLGVEARSVPGDLEGAAEMYRSLLAGKRFLILLDNVRTVAQVRPLLPASAGCLVLVTSRDQLAGLIARDGAQRLPLDMLPHAEALELLRRIVGNRVEDEPDAAAALLKQCGYLPLAVRVAAASLAIDPHRRIAELVADLGRDRRLSALEIHEDQDSSVRTVIDQSYRALSGPSARMFRLLGLIPATDFAPAAAAALGDLSLQAAGQLLDQLVAASLVTQTLPGRFTMHDLLRDYARELTEALDSPDERDAATTRLIDYYLHSANAADEMLYPQRNPLGFTLPQPAAHAETLVDREDAIGWFRREHSALLALLAETIAAEKDEDTHRLATCTANYLELGGHWADAITIQRAVIEAAHRRGDLAVKARTHRSLGSLYSKTGQDDEAHSQLQAALDLYLQLDDRLGAAQTHVRISMAYEHRQQYAEALHSAELADSLYQGTTDERGWAHALNNIAWNQAQLGRYHEAKQPCQAAIEILDRIADHYGLAGALDSLGFIQHHSGAYPQAADAYKQALELFRSMGNRFGEADTLDHLAETLLAAGDVSAARRAWESAMEIFAELGHARAAAVAKKASSCSALL